MQRKPLKDSGAQLLYSNAIQGVCSPWPLRPVSIRIYFQQIIQMVKPGMQNSSKDWILHSSTAPRRDNIRLARSSRSLPWRLAWEAVYTSPRQPGTASMIGPNYLIRCATIGPGIIARGDYRPGFNAIPPTASPPAY